MKAVHPMVAVSVSQKLTSPSSDLKAYQKLMRASLEARKEAVGPRRCHLNPLSALVQLLQILPEAPEEVALDVLAWSSLSRQNFSTRREPALAASTDLSEVELRIAELQDSAAHLIEELQLAMAEGSLEKMISLCEENTTRIESEIKTIEAML